MQTVDLYDSTYGNFTEKVLDAIRRETFGDDFGQNSWITVDEHDQIIDLANLNNDSSVLEVASGSGGSALRIASKVGCKVTGVDINESAVATARELALTSKCSDRLSFELADGNLPLPFESGSFDALICIDSINHLPNRKATLEDWARVLKKGARAVFTDPVVLTGPVTSDELASRSSIGAFLFVPRGVNEELIDKCGLALVHFQDVTDNAASVASKWHDARNAHRSALMEIEGPGQFEALQDFFGAVHQLSAERRLSRHLYVAEKR